MTTNLIAPRAPRITRVRSLGTWPQLADTNYYRSVLAMADLKGLWTGDPTRVVSGALKSITNHVAAGAPLVEVSGFDNLVLDADDVPAGGQLRQVMSFNGDTTLNASGFSFPAGSGTATYTVLAVFKGSRRHVLEPPLSVDSAIWRSQQGNISIRKLGLTGTTLTATVGTTGSFLTAVDRYCATDWDYAVCSFDDSTKLLTIVVNGGTPVVSAGTTQTWVSTAFYVGGSETGGTPFFGKIGVVAVWTGLSGVDGDLFAAGREDDLAAVKAFAELCIGRYDMLSPPDTGVPSWLPHVGGVPATMFADLTTEGGVNHYWAHGAAKASFAAWLADLSGTFTRASSNATYIDNTGLRATAATDAVRFDYDEFGDRIVGLLYEPAATNLAMWSRDLTNNSAWTASGITALKNVTGADGVSNSATRLTATGSNGTILQSVTAGSAAYIVAASVKRITGSGTVEMTIDGGATWHAIATDPLFHRLGPSTQTLANPSIGFRIGTSGDAIGVDFVQLEAATIATSPIATTSSTATRAVDTLTFNVPPQTAQLKLVFDDGTSSIVTLAAPGNPQTITPDATRRRITQLVGALAF